MRTAALIVLAFVAAAPAVAAPAAPLDDDALIGDWVIVEAAPAPWADEARHAALAATGKRMLKTEITFKAGEVVSKFRPFACKRARYEATSYEADALFQGNLPEPNPTAAAVRFGFQRGENPGIDLRCTGGLFSYHFRDRNTALTAFDNVIYTLKRK